MDRLQAMNLFVKVAELGSFTAAAAKLGLARSVVTRQIAALEEHLGIKLMIRSTRRLSLTSAGSAYLEKCREVLDLVQEAEDGVREERLTPSGPLRISLPLSYGLRCLVPMLLDFSQSCPDVRLLLNFNDRQLNLIEEGIDVSIRVTSQLNPEDIVRRLGSSRLLTVASPGYLARRGRPQHPGELEQHACLGYSDQMDNRPWRFRVDGRLQSFHVPLHMYANNGDALAEAAVRGMGVTMAPDFIIAEHLAEGRLEALLEAYEPPALGIYAVLPSNRYMPHRIRVLVDFLASRLAAGVVSSSTAV